MLRAPAGQTMPFAMSATSLGNEVLYPETLWLSASGRYWHVPGRAGHGSMLARALAGRWQSTCGTGAEIQGQKQPYILPACRIGRLHVVLATWKPRGIHH